jgi:hypothetical protein
MKKHRHKFWLCRIEYGRYVYRCYDCGKEIKEGDKCYSSELQKSDIYPALLR